MYTVIIVFLSNSTEFVKLYWKHDCNMIFGFECLFKAIFLLVITGIHHFSFTHMLEGIIKVARESDQIDKTTDFVISRKRNSFQVRIPLETYCLKYFFATKIYAFKITQRRKFFMN